MIARIRKWLASRRERKLAARELREFWEEY